jgi:MFS family permease
MYRERPAYFGIIGMTWAFASAIGPLLGGVLTEKASWKWCFYINRKFLYISTRISPETDSIESVPCIAICFLVVLFKLNVHSPKTPVWEGLKAVDWLGSIIMITSTVLLLYIVQVGGVEQPWTSAMVLSFMIVGILLGILFVLVEWKVARYPLMPLRIFRHSTVVAAHGVACFHSMTLIGGAYFLPLYFQGVLGASPLQSGIYLIPLTVSLSLVNCGVGFWVSRTGKYILAMRISTLLMALGFGLFISLPDKYEWVKIITYQFIAGAGLGPNFQCPLIAMQAATPQADHAVASSAFNFFRRSRS